MNNEYVTGLHKYLQGQYGSEFQLNEQQFQEKLNNDLEYVNGLYGYLQGQYGSQFTLSPEEFSGKVKKKDQSQSGYGQTQPGSGSKTAPSGKTWQLPGAISQGPQGLGRIEEEKKAAQVLKQKPNLKFVEDKDLEEAVRKDPSLVSSDKFYEGAIPEIDGMSTTTYSKSKLEAAQKQRDYYENWDADFDATPKQTDTFTDDDVKSNPKKYQEAVVNDYLEYLKNTNGEDSQTYLGAKEKIEYYKSLGDKLYNDEDYSEDLKEYQKIQKQALSKIGRNAYAKSIKLQNSYDWDYFSKTSSDLQLKAESISKQIKDLNITEDKVLSSVQQKKLDDLMSQYENVQQEFSKLSEDTRIDDNVVSEMMRTQNKMSRVQKTVSDIENEDSVNAKKVKQYYEELEANKKAQEEFYNTKDDGYLETAAKSVAIIGQKTASSFVSGMVSMLDVPKITGEAFGAKGYGWTDKMSEAADYINSYVDLYSPQLDSDKLGNYMSAMSSLGEGVGSVLTFVTGGVGVASAGKVLNLTQKSLNLANKAGQFAVASSLSTSQMYDEFLQNGFAPEQASRFAIGSGIVMGMAEMLVPEDELIANQLKQTLVSSVRSGATAKEAIENGLKFLGQKSYKIAETGLKEYGEESVGELAQSSSEQVASAVTGKKIDNIWNVNDFTKAGLVGGGVGTIVELFKFGSKRGKNRNPFEEDMVGYLAENYDDMVKKLSEANPEAYDQIADRYGKLKEIYNGLKNTPAFNQLSKADQNHVLAQAHTKQVILENIKQSGLDKSNFQNELNEIEEDIFLTLNKVKSNAVQESSTEEVLPRQQGATTEAGGQPEGMGQSVQGQEVTQEGQTAKKEVTVYRGTSTGNKSDKDGVAYYTPNRDYAAFYDSGKEKSDNTALQELEDLKEPAKPLTQEPISDNELVDLVQSLGYNFNSVSDIKNRIDELNLIDSDKITVEERNELQDLSSEYDNYDVNKVEGKNKQALTRYESELSDYNKKKSELESKSKNYLSPKKLSGNFFNLGIDFSEMSPEKIFEKLKSLGISNKFKGGNFLDNYHSDLVEFARKNNIDFFDGIIGGIQGSMNTKPEEIIEVAKLSPEAQRQEKIAKEASAGAAEVVTDLNASNALAASVFPVVGEVEAQIENGEFVSDEKSTEAQDKLYELLGDIDAREDLTPEQKQRMSAVIENRIQKIQDYDYRTRTETSTTTQTVAAGTTPKAQKQNERAAIPVRTVAEEGIDVTYDGRQGRVELRDGQYVFIPKKLGAVQARPVVIGEAAQVNAGSKFAGVENPTTGPNNSVANITLPNGSTLSVLNDDLSIDIGLEIAKQEVGAAPQALFDTVFEEVVTENKVEVPYLRETKPAQEQAATTEQATEQVAEQAPTNIPPSTQQAQAQEQAPATEEKPAYTGNTTQDRALKEKYKADGLKRRILDQAQRIASALGKNTQVYVYETTEEYNAAIAERLGEEQKESTNGRFLYGDGVSEIHIDLSKANEKTLPHEAVHAVLYKAFGENEKLFQQFKDKLKPLLANSTVAELENFANQETYIRQGVTAEEFLAELGGVMTAAGNRIPKTTLQKITQLLNEFLSKITGGRIAPLSTGEVIDLFNSMAEAFASGKAVNLSSLNKLSEISNPGSQIDGNVIESKKSINNSIISDFDTTPIKEDNNPVNLIYPDKSSIEQVLEKSGGAAVFINSDGTKVGSSIINGKQIILHGGVDYTFIEQNVNEDIGFAASEDEKIKTLKTIAQEVSDMRDAKNPEHKGKPVAVFVVVQNGETMLGEWYAAEYIMEGLDKAITSKKYPGGARKAKSDFLKAIEAVKTNVKTVSGRQDEKSKNKLISFIKSNKFDTHSGRLEISKFLSSKEFSFGFRVNLNGELIPSNTKSWNSGKNRDFKQAMALSNHTMDEFYNNFLDGRLLKIIKATKLASDKGKSIANRTFSGFFYNPSESIENQINHAKLGIEHNQFNSSFKSEGNFLLENAHNVNSLNPDMGYPTKEGYSIYNKENNTQYTKTNVGLKEKNIISTWLNKNGFSNLVVNPYSSIALSIYTGYVEQSKSKLKSKSQTTTVYNASPKEVSELGKRSGVAYFATNKREADEYARMNRGEVREFNIPNSDIQPEQVVIDKINELGLKPKDSSFNVDESSLFELIDDRFENSLSKQDIDKLFKALKDDGVKAFEYTDETQVVGGLTTSIAVIDNKYIQELSTGLKSKSQAIPKATTESKDMMSEFDMAANKTGLAKENSVRRFVEKYGEKGLVAKEINDNFEKIQEQLGITKICNI